MGTQVRGLDKSDLNLLFNNEMILPAQFYPLRNNYTSLQPEKKLAFAIFEDAVQCLVAYQCVRLPSGRKLYSEAREWFTTSDPEAQRHIFSFQNCCAILGYDSSVVLRALERYLAATPVRDLRPEIKGGVGWKGRTAVFRAQRLLAGKEVAMG